MSDGVVGVELNLSASPQASTSTHTQNRGRKKIRDTAKWKRNIAKLWRNEGKSYISLSTGKCRSAKLMKDGCGHSCRYKCKTNICDMNRDILFHSFWKLSDVNKQRHFIEKYSKQISKKVRN